MVTEQEVKEKTIERFWSKIKFGELNECWEWIGHKVRKGYGQFMLTPSYRVKKHIYAHRYIYEKMFGEFDPELRICHTCDNPSCINPNHLWIGTVGDNNRDRQRKGRTKGLQHRGSKQGQSKLKEEDIEKIKLRLRTGELQKDIAKSYGVSGTTISFINSNKRWFYPQS